jgi:DNA-binding beta-propeller fold protein YncE
MSQPGDVAVDESGRVFVSDHGNARVDVFTGTGASHVFAFGKDVGGTGKDTCTTSCQEGDDEGTGSLDYPTDVAVGPDGNVYVAYNGFTSGVAVFTPQGAFLRRFGDTGPQALDGASALALDATGAAHVVDEVTEAVKTFGPTGAFVSEFAAEGAVGLARDCSGAFFVSDYDGAADSSKVRRYGEPGTALPPCPPPVVPIATVVPSNNFKFGKLKLDKKKGTATLTIKIPAAGRLVLKGNGLTKVVKNAKKAGDMKLAIKPKGKVKQKLAELGKAVAKAKLTFTPTGGDALIKPRSLVLKKTV